MFFPNFTLSHLQDKNHFYFIRERLAGTIHAEPLLSRPKQIQTEAVIHPRSALEAAVLFMRYLVEENAQTQNPMPVKLSVVMSISGLCVYCLALGRSTVIIHAENSFYPSASLGSCGTNLLLLSCCTDEGVQAAG